MKNLIVCIFGRKGSGKTNLARSVLLEQRRVLVVDSIGEYEGCQIYNPEDLADYLNARGEGPFRVSYRDKGLDGREMDVKFRMIQDVRRCWIGFEEAGKWIGPSSGFPEARWFPNYGRHNAISMLFVARRPTEISRDVTANADAVICFQFHEPRDLQYIREIGGDDAAERIAALGPHEWDFALCESDEAREMLESLGGREPETDSRAGDAMPEPDPLPDTPQAPETPPEALPEPQDATQPGARRRPGRPRKSR